MQKIIHEYFEELIPEYTYIIDINENELYMGLCAKHIDESQYKDITDEEAEAILNKEIDTNE